MLTIDQNLCIQCETCVEDCSKHALEVVDGVLTHDPEQCNWCGHCLSVCPRDAIMIDGDGYDCMDVEDMGFRNYPNLPLMRTMIMGRRSIRHFTDDPVTGEQVERILEAGKYSPTGRNRQGNAFLVVTSPEEREKLTKETADALLKIVDQIEDPEVAELCRSRALLYKEEGIDEIFYNAPVIIYVFSDNDIDGSICATLMGFLALSQELGFCFEGVPVRAFKDPEFAARWQAPEGKKCVLALAIGKGEPQYFSSVPRLDPPTVWL